MALEGEKCKPGWVLSREVVHPGARPAPIKTHLPFVICFTLRNTTMLFCSEEMKRNQKHFLPAGFGSDH